jgi:hypothetical protein
MQSRLKKSATNVSITSLFLYIQVDIGQCWIFAAILKMATARNFSMSGINSGHHNLPTYEMSLKSDNVEYVRNCGGHFENNDVPNWFLTSKNFYLSPFSKWPPQYRTYSTLFDFRGSFWLIFLTTYEMSLKSDNVEFVRYCGGHFVNGDC